MPNITGTMFLKIMKGVAKVPQDSQSSEIGLDEIDLLDPTGFACDEYQMKLPTMKSSAVYADSPLTDGRTLINGALGNVTETIRLTLNGSTLIQTAAMLSKLARFKQDCNDFWDTFGQIEPVYLKHQIDGEPGPRYALLYDIDIDVESPIEPHKPMRIVTLSVERECYWRSLAPGDNPKHWYYIANNQAQQWNKANANLVTGIDHRVYSATLNNRAELATAVTGYLKQNFIDIPADSIPGDAPALLSISVQPTSISTAPTTLIFGKTTKKTTGNIARTTGNNQFPILTLNAADGGVLTDTTLANDTGASRPIGGGTAQRSETTFVTATMANRIVWAGNQFTNGLDIAVMRGRYAVFARARVSAAATVNLQLAYTAGSASNLITNTAVTLTDTGAGGTGNSTDWAIVYLGVMTIAPNNRTDISAAGTGVFVDTGSNMGVYLQASRTSGAGLLYVTDLFLLPIDEGAIRIQNVALVSTTQAWNYDNTGYYTHGHTDSHSGIITIAASRAVFTPEIGGQDIMLTPGVQNRIIMLAYVASTMRSVGNDPVNFTVRINLIPRWIGLRNV